MTKIAIALALGLAGAGCSTVDVSVPNPERTVAVKEIVLVPFGGINPKMYAKSTEGVTDAEDKKEIEDYNAQALKDYGAFPARFAEEVVKGLKNTKIAEKPPASGYYVAGTFQTVQHGSRGARIGGAFGGAAGAVAQEEGKVQVVFLAELREAGANRVLAEFRGRHEDKSAFAGGGYEAVWDLSERLAHDLAARLRDTVPALAPGS